MAGAGAAGFIYGFYLGWHLHRCHRISGHAQLHADIDHRHLFPSLFSVSACNGQPFIMAGPNPIVGSTGRHPVVNGPETCN